MNAIFSLFFVFFVGLTLIRYAESQRCRSGCHPPDCSCPRFSYPMDTRDIPQMVYFGFDDAVNVVMSSLYDKIFTEKRKNPNGCTIKMTLFVSHQYTDYRRVKGFYDRGHEIAVHSVTHSAIDTAEKLRKEAGQQKQNIVQKAGVPANEIVGWRSPFLKPAGDSQPAVLKELGYEYDISLTYSRPHATVPKPWPFTMDMGWVYRCGVRPCPTRARVPNFWAVPVVSLMDHKGQYPCSFVDGCAIRAQNEDEAFQFLMDNFLSYYNTTRTPFGLNMHAAWFYTKYNLNAMMRFLDELQKMEDVYVVTVKQMLDWMKHPTPLSEIHNLESWTCEQSRSKHEMLAAPSFPVPSAWEWDSMTGPETRRQLIQSKPPVRSSTAVRSTTPSKVRSTSILSTSTASTTTTQATTTRRSATTTPTPTTTISTTSTASKTTTTTTASTSKSTLTTTLRPTAKQIVYSQTNILRENTNTARARNQHNKSKEHKRLSESLAKPTTLSQGKSWWNIWQDPTVVHIGCAQGINCKLPNCFCQGSKIPNDLKRNETPQLVYLTIDGTVTLQVYRRYMQFMLHKKNPNGCPVKGTIFASGQRSSPDLMKRLMKMGAEIAMQGLHEHHFESTQQLEEELASQMRDMIHNNITVSGWKTPELKALGNEQYKILQKYGLKYDATITENIPKVGTHKQWPYTLDFGHQGACVIPECPTAKFARLWEIPVNSIIDYRKFFECTYIDGCMFNPPTAEDTENFLWDNFVDNYQTNRAPFGIHLRQVWFTHPAYAGNIRGLKNFIAKLLKLKDVYLVSVSDMISWIENPVKVQDITDTVPWNCKTS